MGQVTQNRAIGTIMTTTRIRVGQTVTVLVSASDGTPANLEANRFERGRLVASSRSLVVDCNLTNTDTTDDFCNDNASVRVRNQGGPLVTL